MNEQRLTLKEAAERAGVSPSTLRRWAETGVIPEVGGNDHGITAAGAAHAHIVVRLRERGHPLGSTEEEEDEEALSFVESLIEAVNGSLPEGALVEPRGGVPAALPGSAAAANRDDPRREPPPRRRVLRGGEVLVTDSVVEAVEGGGDRLEFDEIGQVKLKGLDQPRRRCRALARE